MSVYTCSARGGGSLKLAPQDFRGLSKKLVFGQTTHLGFTLAEVLITLGIIGVVAAMTLSNLIYEYKKEVTVNKLRHVYSLLKNAESMAVKDYGDMSNWDFIGSGVQVAPKYYFPYLKTNKCKYKKKIQTSTGISFGLSYTDQNYVCLPDGVVVISNTLSNGYMGTIVFADLNGEKGPNVVGRDVFTFLINRPVYKSDDYNTSSYRVVPKCPVGISTCFPGPYHGAGGFYWEGDEETLIKYCVSGTGDSYTMNSGGNSCAYMIEQAGWKVPKNYPLRI